jgi:hypothetical protein
MFDEEVVIARFLESRVVGRIEPIACLLESQMKMNGILKIRVVRRKVGAPAKPAAGAAFKVSEVGVDGRHERIEGMKDERDATREELSALTDRQPAREGLVELTVDL